MATVHVKLRRRRDTLANIDGSKFLGDPTVPAELDADRVLGDDEIFLCQLDCEEIKRCVPGCPLPDRGWLWFFVDLDDFPYTPRVIYSKWGPEFVLEEYNEEWVEDTTRAYGVTFTSAAQSSGICLFPQEDGDELVLLRLQPQLAQLGVLAGAGETLDFVIRRDRLAELDFSGVKLVIK